MITKEYQEVISENNLLRAKIMLKDSLIVDTSFRQFDEMLAYAKSRCPQIIETFSGDQLEPDLTKWNKELMNLELVELVNNFSVERIEHLKKVISIALKPSTSILPGTTSVPATSATAPKAVNTYDAKVRNNYSSSHESTPTLDKKSALRRHNRKSAYQKLVNQGKIITEIIQQTRNRGWSASNVEAMERAAYDILDAVKLYDNNKEK